MILLSLSSNYNLTDFCGRAGDKKVFEILASCYRYVSQYILGKN